MRNRPAVFLSLFFHYRSYYFSIDPLGPFVEASRRGQCETKRRPWFHALTVENKSYRRVGIVTALSLIKLVRPSKSTSSTAIFISPMHCMHTRYVNLASEKKKKKTVEIMREVKMPSWETRSSLLVTLRFVCRATSSSLIAGNSTAAQIIAVR